MAYYLLQGSYTAETLANLVKNPQDRAESIRPIIEGLGGTLEGAWFALGDYDIVVVCQMPDNVSAAAFAIAGSAGGSLKTLKTTPLLTMEDGLEGFRRASGSGYQPPAG